ncbi:hypothetical protein PR202_gb16812 [Eleusine coracana subsp. coracana]|uniref:O-fucosyltransferase family protein n=1 Tax=Eleusine coracana subsp. coracana TaxID=191504 RepID=A0AAV5F164_ELECO|nr:hypothetical protein PR202_gb16754 [Eleusine coracana subsp. coracana]GJN28660.1 hypothetical protein PR202_gb16812 [Eleusine coracana subsp. coracana]
MPPVEATSTPMRGPPEAGAKPARRLARVLVGRRRRAAVLLLALAYVAAMLMLVFLRRRGGGRDAPARLVGGAARFPVPQPPPVRAAPPGNARLRRARQSDLPPSNGFLIVEANGGLNQQRISICDAVAVARILNATLVTPVFHVNSVWRDSSKFGDIFDEEHFIESLQKYSTQVGMMLRGMGFDNTTSLYVASGKIYNSEKYMTPLRQLFPLLQTKENLASPEELTQLKGHSSRLAALDYTVCLHSEAFVATQGSNFPHFVVGHRRYLHGGCAKTIKPDKQKLVLLFDNPNMRSVFSY